MRAKLRQIKAELKARLHEPVTQQGRWLGQVVTGWFIYHAVPTNSRALGAFRYHVTDLWRRTLRRRGQKDDMTWAGITALAKQWLPPPHVLHPWPATGFTQVICHGRSRSRRA